MLSAAVYICTQAPRRVSQARALHTSTVSSWTFCWRFRTHPPSRHRLLPRKTWFRLGDTDHSSHERVIARVSIRLGGENRVATTTSAGDPMAPLIAASSRNLDTVRAPNAQPPSAFAAVSSGRCAIVLYGRRIKTYCCRSTIKMPSFT